MKLMIEVAVLLRVAVLLSFFLPLGLQAGSILSASAAGYIYGFPLVLMDETLHGLTSEERSCQLGTDLNTFMHVKDRPGPEFKAVVRPNVDTLYSSAMLDLSHGPMLLYMPAVQNRYVLMALLDAWSNNFAGVGSQSHGEGEGRYAIVGPDWVGDLPEVYERIDAPTNLVWVIGRTEVRDDADIPAVNRIQEQYSLTPLAGPAPLAGNAHCVPDSEKTPPIEVVESLSGHEYFSRLAELMVRYPPPQEDAAMLKVLARIGVGPLAEKDLDDLSSAQRRRVEMGRNFGLGSLNFATRLLGLNGWGPNPAQIPLGDFGQRYFIRGVVAQVGFGANRGEFAVYQNAERDSKRQRLSGDAVYSMTFAADDLPPVQAFWSVTIYGDDGFLRDNPVADRMEMTRYALGSNNGLVEDERGNVTLYFSAEPPGGVPLENWLPVPEGRFQATVRYYAPEESILSNRWRTPPIVKREDLMP